MYFKVRSSLTAITITTMGSVNQNILSTLLPDDPSESKHNKLNKLKNTNNLLPSHADLDASCVNQDTTNADKSGYMHYNMCYNTIIDYYACRKRP